MPILNRQRLLLGTVVPLLSGCASAAFVTNYEVAKTSVASSTGIDDQDLQDLRSGRIDLVRQRYEARGADNLSPKQLLLLSDIYLKYGDFGKASTTLALYVSRSGDRSDGITGREALIALALGQPARAASLANGSDDGSRYVRALAAARTGDTGTARTAAAQFGRSYDPKQVYYAANLYSAVADNKAALDLLLDPERRLLRDYGVSTLQTLFGPGKTAPFRLDIFNQFSAGWFDVYSYAPAGNVYVEYLAAHSLLELGRPQEAVQHLDALLAYPGLPAYRDVEWLVLYRPRPRGKASRSAG